MCEWDFWPEPLKEVGDRYEDTDHALPGLSSAEMWENEFLHRREEIRKEG